VSSNPIHQLLDDLCVPWQLSRTALAERYGIHQHPAYQWDVIAIETSPPIMRGLMWPLDVQVRPQFSPAMPATNFSAIARIGDDARENLRHSLEQLEPRLGMPEVADSANTLGKRWTFGAASLSITVWPPELQPPELRLARVNPSHQREPLLKTACHLSIETGWQAAASPAELTQLASFVPIGSLQLEGRGITPRSADTSPAEQSELEFVRRPTGELRHLFGFVGHSADHTILIFWHRQLYLVSMADVISFHVDRFVRAKGPGGAKLYVECRTNYEDLPTKRLLIAAASRADDLNKFAQTLSAATGRPFALSRYWPDD
jgi:hypothetical protein